MNCIGVLKPRTGHQAYDRTIPGDLATFREPETGKLITHRVQSIIWHGELADVITRGDANELGENWSVSSTDRVGEVVLRAPRAGYVVGLLSTPAGQLALAPNSSAGARDSR